MFFVEKLKEFLSLLAEGFVAIAAIFLGNEIE